MSVSTQSGGDCDRVRYDVAMLAGMDVRSESTVHVGCSDPRVMITDDRSLSTRRRSSSAFWEKGLTELGVPNLNIGGRGRQQIRRNQLRCRDMLSSALARGSTALSTTFVGADQGAPQGRKGPPSPLDADPLLHHMKDLPPAARWAPRRPTRAESDADTRQVALLHRRHSRQRTQGPPLRRVGRQSHV
jgi:hypothetical protein